MPRGHVLVEPYLFDVRSQGSDYLGSLTYILFGLTDNITVGAIPTFGGTRPRNGGPGRRIAINDLTLTAQLQVDSAAPGDLMPAVSLVLQHTLPLGRFDRLGADLDRGIGAGTHGTLAGLYAQRVDHLPNGRPLRTRINLTRSVAWRGRVRDESIYGTPSGFSGSVHPGSVNLADVSFEYSVNQRWVLAVDLVARWTGKGRVEGLAQAGAEAWRSSIGSSTSVSVAPAVEYSWSATRGAFLGVRITPEGRNAGASVTPVIAFNAVF